MLLNGLLPRRRTKAKQHGATTRSKTLRPKFGLPPPKAEQVLSYWDANEGWQLEEPMKHVQLIKVASLIELGELQMRQRAAGEPLTVMPRCQDWEPHAIADPDELRKWSKGEFVDRAWVHPISKAGVLEVAGLPIIVLSICWLDPDHPDKFGEQLEQLLPIFRYFAAEGPFAVLWDYCSLPQKRAHDAAINASLDDRTDSQKEIFKAGLMTINR